MFSTKNLLDGSSLVLRAHGLGGGSAIFHSFPLFQSAEGGQRGREATALFCVSRKAKRKNFRSLIEKILSGARIKKYVENFSFLLLRRQAELRRRRAGSAPLRAQNSAQSRFEHRSVIATRCNTRQFEESLIARSASLTLGSARKFPYISGLNQRGGQNQKLPFCSGEGGSWAQSVHSKSHLIKNPINVFAVQFFPPLAEGKRTKQVFKNPTLSAPKAQWPKATLLKN